MLSRVLWCPVTSKQQAQGISASTAIPDLAVLTALTSLTLYSCLARLAGLQALTQLKSLSCSTTEQIPAAIANLAAALPRLQQPTFLYLSHDLACDTVLAQLSCLTCLRQLVASHLISSCSGASFAALPKSLTSLRVYNGGFTIHGSERAQMPLSPNSTPGICKLTALQELFLDNLAIETSFLGFLTALRSLKISSAAAVTAAAGKPKWLELSKLTLLQAVDLSCSWDLEMCTCMQVSACANRVCACLVCCCGHTVWVMNLCAPLGCRFPHVHVTAPHTSTGLSKYQHRTVMTFPAVAYLVRSSSFKHADMCPSLHVLSLQDLTPAAGAALTAF